MIVVPANASILAWSSPDTCRVPIHPAGQSHLCEVMEVGAYSHTHARTHITSHQSYSTWKSVLNSLFNIFWCNHYSLKSTQTLLCCRLYMLNFTIHFCYSKSHDGGSFMPAPWIIYDKDKALSVWQVYGLEVCVCIKAWHRDPHPEVLCPLSWKMGLGCRIILVICMCTCTNFSFVPVVPPTGLGLADDGSSSA